MALCAKTNEDIEMEDRARYTVNDQFVYIRTETLTPYSRWERPTPEEIRSLIHRLNLSDSEIAELVGASTQGASSGSRTVRAWKTGERNIPYAAWAILAHEAGYRSIWSFQ